MFSSLAGLFGGATAGSVDAQKQQAAQQQEASIQQAAAQLGYAAGQSVNHMLANSYTSYTLGTSSIGTAASGVSWPQPPSTTDCLVSRLYEDMEDMKEVIGTMKKHIAKLEGEVIRLGSSGEGKDRAADDILKQMDCYLA